MPTVDVPLWNRKINFSLSIRFGSSCPFAYRSHTYDCVYVYLIHVIHFPRKISASNIICERYIYINCKSYIFFFAIYFSLNVFHSILIKIAKYHFSSFINSFSRKEKRNSCQSFVIPHALCATTKTYFNRGFVLGRDRNSRYFRLQIDITN